MGKLSKLEQFIYDICGSDVSASIQDELAKKIDGLLTKEANQAFSAGQKLRTRKLNHMLDFKVTNYRDVDRNKYIQVTATCKCGRGGFVRIPTDSYKDYGFDEQRQVPA